MAWIDNLGEFIEHLERTVAPNNFDSAMGNELWKRVVSEAESLYKDKWPINPTDVDIPEGLTREMLWEDASKVQQTRIAYTETMLWEQIAARYGLDSRYMTGTGSYGQSLVTGSVIPSWADVDDWTYWSRYQIGFSDTDIDTALRRGWTVWEIDTSLGKSYFDTLTPDQQSKYMGWLNGEKEFKRWLNSYIDIWDNNWKKELQLDRTIKNLRPGYFWYWDSQKGEWIPEWGRMLKERAKQINIEIELFRKINPPPDFRTPIEKLNERIKITGQTAAARWKPDLKFFGGKILDVTGWIGAAIEWITFLVELQVFAMFIYEEALQISARWVYQAMWPKPNLPALYGILHGNYDWVFASAANQFISAGFLLLYTHSGYRAYLNAASIHGDCARMLLGEPPQGIIF